MKALVLISLVIFSFSACSKEAEKKVESKKTAEVKKEAATKDGVPCDSKEDLLKKLEEKKKSEAEKGKGFSLQGGDTGCKVK